MLLYGGLSQARAPSGLSNPSGLPNTFGQDQFQRPGSYFGPANPNYQSVPNAFAPSMADLGAPMQAPTFHPLTSAAFLASMADARAQLAASLSGLRAERATIKPMAHQAIVRTRHDTRYNIGQSEESFANRGVFESGGRIAESAHQQRLGDRKIQDISQQAAAAYRQITEQMKQARLTAQQQADQAAQSASQQAAANPMPVGAYQPGTGNRVVAVAHNQIGDPYRWGAEGPTTFDCSGLYWYSMNQAGIKIPRLTAQGYYDRSRHVSRSGLRPGDAVYFSYGSGVDHMGVYAGNGFMIVAPHSGATVSYMRVDWSHFVGGGRIGHT